MADINQLGRRSKVSCPGRGTYVVVVGPDGTGKSTVVQGLIEGLLAGPVQLLHHRPHVLGGLATHDGAVTEPHRSSPYPRWLSIVKLIFLFFDHLVGWLVKLRPWLRSGGHVILERGWWDLAVDPLRYRLQPLPGLVKLLGRCLPRPDLTVVLGGDPKVIAGRKGELSVAETARQLAAWERLCASAGHTVIVEATAPRDRVLAAVSDALLRPAKAERWLALPPTGTPRWHLPATSARASVNALQLHQPVTTRGRLGWEAARAVALAGGLRLLVRDGEGAPPEEVLDVLAPHLPALARVAVARGSHPGRNTALILDGRTGEPYAFAKIARDDDGPAALAAEVNAGQRLSPLLPPGLEVPKILHAETHLVLFEAVTARPRSRPWRLPPEVAFMLGRFHRAGARRDALGPAHGDCAPWNLLRTPRGWFLVDWAEGRMDAPPFEDVFHFLIQGHSLLGRPRHSEVLAAFAGQGPSGSVVRRYAEGAGLDIACALRLAPSYLERSRAKLPPDASGRRGRQARDALLRSLTGSPQR